MGKALTSRGRRVMWGAWWSEGRRWLPARAKRKDTSERRATEGRRREPEGGEQRTRPCDLVEEAAQLWSREARAAYFVNFGGGLSGPSILCSCASSFSWLSNSATSLCAASCSSR